MLFRTSPPCQRASGSRNAERRMPSSALEDGARASASPRIASWSQAAYVALGRAATAPHTRVVQTTAAPNHACGPVLLLQRRRDLLLSALLPFLADTLAPSAARAAVAAEAEAPAVAAAATEADTAAAQIAAALSAPLDAIDEGPVPLPVPAIRPELAPDQSRYDPKDPELRAAASALAAALNAPSLDAEEAAWGAIIADYSALDRPWVPDVVGRAWGNRGNARSRQGRLREALSDYNRAIALCPWSVDPVLNRGVALEALGRFEEAVADYRAVLAAAPNDPAGWNNLGNATGGLGKWEEAAAYYGRATQLAPAFSFAFANRALALYEIGRTDEAMREMRSLLRRYPDFADMRAALAGALWEVGKEGEAEVQWSRVDDPRYSDYSWLRFNRRWPPRIYTALNAFLELRSLPAL